LASKTKWPATGRHLRHLHRISALVTQGTVQTYDFPALVTSSHVAEAAREAIHAKNHQARCEFVGGDFFQSVPAGADAYVLKFMLVDWRDEEGLLILQNCRQLQACPDLPLARHSG
jgi:O-methyltransferase domain